MLKPIISQFECDMNILVDLLKVLIVFDKEKIKISEDFFAKQLSALISKEEKNVVESRMILGQSFSVFYNYISTLYDEVSQFEFVIDHHIVFKYNKKVVWNSLKFLCKQKGTFRIKKNVILNYLKNDETFFDSENYVREIENIIKVVDESMNSKISVFTISEIEGCFFLLSKMVNLFNYIKINNTVVKSVNDIIVSDNLIMDVNSITEMNNVVERVSKNSYANMADEMIMAIDTIDDNLDNLDYPVCPISMFQKLRLFQEKRNFLFVGASGVGKSMLLSHIASEMWSDPVYKKAEIEGIFYFSMENLKEEVSARIYANSFYRFCGVNRTIDDVIRNLQTVEERNKLKEIIRNSGRQIFVDWLQPSVHGTITFSNLIRRKISERGIVPYAILVDFMDKMKSNTKDSKSETEELGKISDELKGLAAEFSVPVITVSHLNAEGCKLVKEDMAKLQGNQVGKSLRKYENFDVVCFMDEEDSGLGFTLMNFYFSKHRYFKKSIGKIYSFKYLPEYSCFEPLNTNQIKQAQKNIADFASNGIFDDPTVGM